MKIFKTETDLVVEGYQVEKGATWDGEKCVVTRKAGE